MGYVATGLVYVRSPDGAAKTEPGGLLPDGVDPAELDRLLRHGAIVETQEPEPEPEAVSATSKSRSKSK